MKILFLDCGMGSAGDMLQGALLSLLSEDEQKAFIDEINNIGIDGTTEELFDDVKCGITAKHVRVSVHGQEEISEDVHEHGHDHHDGHDHDHTPGHHDDHDHDHGYHNDHEHNHNHDHHHHHVHSHTSMSDIRHKISHLRVSDEVKSHVTSVYEMIAQAESTVHGRDVSEIHFHEVGMMDALMDITAVAMLIEKLKVDKIICSPVNVGFGKVKCAHGILPVPAPATSEIIKGMPVYSGRFEGEMCTPTGAALLKHFASDFSEMPLMTIEKTGYGSGNKNFEAANVIRAVLGQSTDRVIELRCNIDDMTGEDMAYAVEVIMACGAKDAFLTPVTMKKGRSGFLLTVLCDEGDREKFAKIIFKNTSTIGIRECTMERMVLDRKTTAIPTKYGDVIVKTSEGYGVKRTKAEYESLKAIAEKYDMSISQVRQIMNDIIQV